MMDTTSRLDLTPDEVPSLAGLRVTVLVEGGAGFTAVLAADTFAEMLRAADQRLGKGFRKWLRVREAVLAAAGYGNADDGIAVAAICTACRMPNRGRDVERQLGEMLRTRRRACLAVRYDPASQVTTTFVKDSYSGVAEAAVVH